MSIAFSVACAFFLATFLAFSLPMYYKKEKEKYDLRNHFCFELLPPKTDKNYILYIVSPLLYLITFVLTFIFYAINDFGVMNVMVAFLALGIAFSIATIFYLPLSKLRERSIFSIILIVFVAAINGLLIYEETFYIKAYQNNLIYLPIVINGLLLLISIIAVFSPRLFDLGTDKDEKGLIVRKKVYPLALYEWLIILTLPLTQISVIIMEIIKK